MSIILNLESDEALVLFELVASKKIEGIVGIPERNALWALESALEEVLVEPFKPDYQAILARARESVLERYGK